LGQLNLGLLKERLRKAFLFWTKKVGLLLGFLKKGDIALRRHHQDYLLEEKSLGLEPF